MRARGFSLVEFMIAMTIGLFLIAGLVYLIAETSRSRAEIERSSRQIENGRYAIDRIAEDLRHVGFLGEYEPAEDATVTLPTTLPSPCATTIAGLDGGPLLIPIQAYDGGASVPSALSGCLAAADYQPNTDIVVVRRASTSTIATTGTLVANQLYIQTGHGTGAAFERKMETGSNVGTFTLKRYSNNSSVDTTVALLRRYIVRIYFVSPCNVPSSGVSSDPCDAAADGGTPIPTLKMLELGPGPEFQKLAIAEGIEQLRFDFGLDGSNGDGVPDCMVRFSDCGGAAVTSGTEIAHWTNIVGAQVNIVARNSEPSPSYSDDKIYSLGLKGYTAATNDPYRRHAYSAFVRLNNIAMRRE